MNWKWVRKEDQCERELEEVCEIERKEDNEMENSLQNATIPWIQKGFVRRDCKLDGLGEKIQYPNV